MNKQQPLFVHTYQCSEKSGTGIIPLPALSNLPAAPICARRMPD